VAIPLALTALASGSASKLRAEKPLWTVFILVISGGVHGLMERSSRLPKVAGILIWAGYLVQSDLVSMRFRRSGSDARGGRGV
jgi:hypothetical protein